jgi:phospholipid/cholesterol/gamma-HCH transport system permease protein
MAFNIKLSGNVLRHVVILHLENVYTKSFKGFFVDVSNLTLFTVRFFRQLFNLPLEWKEFTRQCFVIGYKSFPLVGLTGFIMGLVMTIQARPTLVQFGAESWLPAMVSVSIIREIGPVITALIFAGKVGSGIGAELGSMKVTEQIDAMEISGINPFKFLVVTRVLAATLMLPVLVITADAISLYGTYVGVNIKGDVSIDLFFLQVLDKLSFIDILPPFVKTFFFGFAIGLIGCYKGYHARNGTEGVGYASNTAVILGSLSVFVVDMIAVQITSLLM